MKKVSALLIGILACLMLFSCEKETILTVNQASLSFNNSGGSQTVSIVANKVWSASSNQSWCKVSPSSGDGSDNSNITLSVSCDANTTYDARTCTITITCEELTKTISVSQAEGKGLFVSQSMFTVPYEEQTIEVVVKSNVRFEYEIVKGYEWISDIQTKGLNSNTLHFLIKANDSSLYEREGIILISDKDSGLSEKVIISQDKSLAEKRVLLDIIEACTSDEWRHKQNKMWDSEIDIKNWGDIAFDEKGRINAISLFGFEGILPESISRLSALRKFCLFSGRLDSFPISLCDCNSLEEINFKGSVASISDIPEDIKKLKKLRILNLSGISFFPIIICDCNSLEVLHIGGNNEIQEIPNDISKLTKLKILEMEQCGFQSFPKAVCYCPNLEELNLSWIPSMEGSIPEEIGNLKKLNDLCLYKNNMKGKLPQSLYSLPCWKQSPFDIIIGNNFDCSASDFIAPTFDLYASDGTRLNSELLYQNHKYTLLYNAKMDQRAFIEDLKAVSTKWPDDVLIVSFLLGHKSYLETYIENNSITWPCVLLDNNPIISGGAVHYSLWGKHTNKEAIMAVDQTGKVAFFTDYNDTTNGIYTFLSGEGYYESNDYSSDGLVITLQTATEGRGIDLVFMGDGYSDRLISDGTYFTDMIEAMEAFFYIEPYKSFRHLFNAYCVIAVSKNDQFDYTYGTETAFNFGLNGTVNGEKVEEYVLKAFNGDRERLNHSTITVIVNSYQGRSCCMGGAYSVSWCLKNNYLPYLVAHETGGHGFGRLADEYIETGIQWVPSKKSMDENHQQWQLMNIDITNDPSQVVWSHFLSDSRYKGEVGIYEGGNYTSKGVFRPSENSIMNTGANLGFNAPSREAIYYRIHKMAYGDEWEYDFEDFANYDIINRQNPQTKSASPQDTIDIRKLTAPPILINDYY